MKKIVVISALLSLVPGCAGTLQLDTSSLFTKKTAGSSEGAAEQPDTARTDATAANKAGTSKEEAPDPVAERRAHYQPLIDQVDALLQQIPECCQGEDFLLQMQASSPSLPFAKDYKKTQWKKKPRNGESEAPEWQALLAKHKELEDALVTAIRLPKDRYKDPDAKQVKKIFSDYAAEHTKKPVVEVVLVEEGWNRKSGSNWKDGALVNFDEGSLRAFVLVEGDSGKGEVWEFIPRKDFIDGGKVKFDVYVPRKFADMELSSAKK